MSQPLDQIITRNPGGYVAEHPEQAPWVQPSGREVEVAQTGDMLIVPLRLAGRVRVHGLDHVPVVEDYDELPEDMTLQSWGLPAA